MTNNLPQGWVECELKDIGEIVSGGTPSTTNPHNFGGDIAWITPADLSNYKQKYISYGARNITEQGLKSSSAKLMPAGSVLFSSRAPIGYVVISNNPICTNQGFKNIVPSKFVNNEFIYYFLKGAKTKAENFASGTTFKEISGKRFGEIPLILPPFNEQKRIVEKIEEEFGKIDEGVEKLKLAQEQIKQYRQSVLKSAFDGKLTNCQMNKIILSEIGHIVTGTTPSTKKSEYYSNQEFPFYKPTDLNNGYNVYNANFYVSKKAYEEHRKLPINSVLVTCIGATIGKTGIIRETGICNQQINAILPNNDIVPEYTYFQCISDYFQEQIKTNASATTLPILNKTEFSKLNFKICNFDEQKQIVKEIEKRFEVADEVERVITENLEKTEQLKQSILKKAFEGRLVPQDPTDQPASVLLEKIKAERNK